MKKTTKLQKLEQKFGMAESLVEELGEAITELEIPDVAENVPMVGETPVGELEAVEESILSMATLKQDFMMVRNNILSLVNTGQKILEQASVMDISDLKPSHLEALSNLQSTIGSNLQLMINIYKDLAAIEKSRVKPVPKMAEMPAQVNTGTINNTNVLFAGSSAELMELINNQVKGKIHDVIEIASDNRAVGEEL